MSEEHQKKSIVIEYCDHCPFEGECKPWKKLTPAQRVRLTIGHGVGRYMLNGCPLPDLGTTENFKPFK